MIVSNHGLVVRNEPQHSSSRNTGAYLASSYRAIIQPMQKKSLIQSNPHLRAPEQYRKALVTNVSSSTAIETGATVASIAKTLSSEIKPSKTPQRSAR